MIFIIPYIVYPYDLMVCVSEPHRTIKKELKKRLPESQDTNNRIKELKGDFKGRTVMFSGGQTVMVLKSTDHDVIAHEVFRAVEFLFRSIYIPLTLESGEAYAYLIGYIAKEIYKRLDEKEWYKRQLYDEVSPKEWYKTELTDTWKREMLSDFQRFCNANAKTLTKEERQERIKHPEKYRDEVKLAWLNEVFK